MTRSMAERKYDRGNYSTRWNQGSKIIEDDSNDDDVEVDWLSEACRKVEDGFG